MFMLVTLVRCGDGKSGPTGLTFISLTVISVCLFSLSAVDVVIVHISITTIHVMHVKM